MKEFNQTPAWNMQAGELPELGEEPWVHETATIIKSRLGAWTEIGPFAEIIESAIGDYSYVAGVHTSISFADVGKFCSIASSVRVNPVNHPMDRIVQHHCTYRRRQYGFDERDDDGIFEWRRDSLVSIGHDVWIGHGATVMPGVSVGTGAVIGSGAVVTRDVEPFMIVAGVPAKPLRQRFPDDVVKRILDSAWWDWPHEKLRERFNSLLDLKSFLHEN